MSRPLALLAALLPPLLLTSLVRADVLLYNVTGNIDTADFLIITGATFQWHHADSGGAAVGRHSGNNFPTVISSSLNGIPQMSAVDWIPTWPNPVPDEIRFDAFSSTLNTITPALPADPANVVVSIISGRGSVSIAQLPTPADNETLIVEFKDGFNGSADLDAAIAVITTPEPASLTLLAATPLLLLRRRKGKRESVA